MRKLALLAVLTLALPAAETAAFPGTNGRLLFTQERQSFQRSVPPSADVCAATPASVRRKSSPRSWARRSSIRR